MALRLATQATLKCPLPSCLRDGRRTRGVLRRVSAVRGRRSLMHFRDHLRACARGAAIAMFLLGAGTLIASIARADRTATYLAGTSPFSQNVTLLCPFAPSDGEPSIRCDVRGNCYVAPIRGVPGGVD